MQDITSGTKDACSTSRTRCLYLHLSLAHGVGIGSKRASVVFSLMVKWVDYPYVENLSLKSSSPETTCSNVFCCYATGGGRHGRHQ